MLDATQGPGLLGTFESRVQHPLLDLGFLHQVGCGLRQDQLPRPGLEALPVVLDHRHAVLERGEARPSTAGRT